MNTLTSLLYSGVIAGVLTLLVKPLFEPAKMNLNELVNNINQSAQLPRTQDGLRIDPLTLTGNSLTIHYHMLDFDSFMMPSDIEASIKQNVSNMYCTVFLKDPQMRELSQEQHIGLVAKFYNAKDRPLTSIYMQPEQCL